MKKYWRQFLNLKFRKKIIGISIIISLIPIILLGIFSYVQMYSLLIERERTALQETLSQEVLQLDYKLNSYLSAVNLIAWNENVRIALSQPYDTNYNMYLVYRDTIDPLFLSLRSLNSDITSITIYSDSQLNSHGSALRSLSEAEVFPWYEQACASTNPFFYPSDDGKTLYLICQMYYKYVPYTNIICMSIDLRSALSPTHTLFSDNFGFLLADSSENLLYQVNDFESDIFSRNYTPSLLQNEHSSDFITETESLENVDWNAFLYRPTVSISTAARNITYIVFAIVLLCLVLIAFVSIILSRIIVSPIEELSSSMEQVEKGNYEINIYSDNTDEVGQLITSFRKMVSTLNSLVNEVLGAKIREQRYEIELLQSQINPHFLYNSLSLINSKAILSGQSDISQMARLLSSFYRTMLNKGNQITTCASELENTKSYIAIQQIMHSYSFDVVYDIDEQIMKHPIPCLLLQPLVENSILHGLDHKEIPGKAMLSLSCYIECHDIVFKVMDNGCGMTEEECMQILSYESKGYGVKNVHQRIQLYYGSDYGLTYHSTKGMGTYVLLRIKASIPTSSC